VLLVLASAATAATYDGVTVPDRRDVNGTLLVLNGIGLRTATIFNVHVYVAALYLKHRNSDAAAILHSPEEKLLELHIVHDLAAEQVRKSWAEAFARTCKPPCHLRQDQVDRFLTALPSARHGDVVGFHFSQRGLSFTLDGHEMGRIADQEFAQVLLAVFIGEAPASERLKRSLLGLPE